LVTLRKRRRLTQARLAKLTGVPQCTISRLENQAPLRPTADVVVALAEYFGIGVTELMFGPDPLARRERAHQAAS